jgi:hypothetical protein
MPVHLHRDAAERRHRVDDEQRPVVVAELAEALERLLRSRRRLGVDERHGLDLAVLLQRLLDALDREHLAPGHLELHELAAAAADDVRHAHPEDAADADEDGVARLDHVDERRLHARRPRAGDGDGEHVRGLEDRPQHRLDLVHDEQELGVEVPEERRRHRAQHARRHRARAGAEEEALRGLQLGNG